MPIKVCPFVLSTFRREISTVSPENMSHTNELILFALTKIFTEWSSTPLAYTVIVIDHLHLNYILYFTYRQCDSSFDFVSVFLLLFNLPLENGQPQTSAYDFNQSEDKFSDTKSFAVTQDVA